MTAVQSSANCLIWFAVCSSENSCIFLLTQILLCHTVRVVKKRTTDVISVRATKDDQKLLDLLRNRLGVEVSQIVRLGLRALAQKEGVQ